MPAFPTFLLEPIGGRIYGQTGDAGIEVRIKPFRLPERGDDQRAIDTALILENIALPGIDLADLAGNSYRFPINPEPGYVDGSIYIGHCHHPVDVSAIRFGELAGDALTIEIDSLIDFEFEGLDDYVQTPWTFRTLIERSQA